MPGPLDTGGNPMQQGEPSPGLCYVVLTYLETGPYMLFLFACLCVRTQTGRLTALHSDFLHPPVGRQGHHLAMMPLPSASTFANLKIR